MTQLEQLFTSFCGHYEPISRPFIDEGIVYATNGYAMIYAPQTVLDFQAEPPGYKTPNAKSKIKPANTNKVLNVKSEYFEPFKMEHGTVVCKHCDGAGEVEWEFKHWTKTGECPACNGQGSIVDKKAPKTFPKYHYTKLGDTYFATRYFYELFEVQKVVGGDIVLTRSGEPYEPHFFDVGNLSVVVMPALYMSENNGVFDITEKLN